MENTTEKLISKGRARSGFVSKGFSAGIKGSAIRAFLSDKTTRAKPAFLNSKSVVCERKQKFSKNRKKS